MFRSLITKSAVAIAAVGMSTFTAVSAEAAAFTTNPANNPRTCTTTQVLLASQCAGIYTGEGLDSNPAPATVLTALNDDDLFGDINAWTFDRRQQRTGSVGPNDLGLTLTGLGSTSGTFTFANISPAITNLVIGLKAANSYALYFIPKGTYAANQVFNWSTSDLLNNGGQPAALSNFNVFYQVPTPALLPGLIGMGIAALRRKNKEAAEADA